MADIAFNNDRLPNEILQNVMQHVSEKGPQGSHFSLSALLACRTWAAAGLPVLWRDVVHQQPGRDTARTRTLVSAITHSTSAKQHTVSLTMTFGNADGEEVAEDESNLETEYDEEGHVIWDAAHEELFPKKPAMRALFHAVAHLYQLQTLAVEFGEGMMGQIVMRDLESLVTSLPQALRNLKIRVRIDGNHNHDDIMSLDGLPAKAIGIAAQRLRKLELDLPAAGINKFLPIAWDKYCPLLQEICIRIGDEKQGPTYQYENRRATKVTVKIVNSAINTAMLRGRLPKLQAGSITAVLVSPRSLAPSEASVAAGIRTKDSLLYRDLLNTKCPDVTVFPLLRVTSGYDIFWAQIPVLPTATHASTIAEVVDGLPNIVSDIQIGAWIETLKGTKIPSSLLNEIDGRFYAPYIRPKNDKVITARRAQAMAQVTAYPKMVTWIMSDASTRVKPQIL